MNIDDFGKAASECENCCVCRDRNYVHNDEKYGWAYPLFHEKSSCLTQIIVIGEAPNYNDTYEYGNLTWDGGTDDTSEFTRELFDSIGLKISDVLFTNSVLCLPARNKEGKYFVKAPQRRKCSKWLEMAINCCDAEIVVTIGAEALEAVKLLSSHKLKLRESVGKAHHWNNRILFPLYHPSKRGRGNRSRDKQFADIQPLKEIISKLNLYTDKY